MNDFVSLGYAEIERRLLANEKHLEELANKVTELDNKFEWARLYGFSRSAEDE